MRAIFGIFFCSLVMFGIASSHALASKQIQVLHSFCKAPQCGDGAYGTLSLDTAGNPFGVAEDGANGKGLIYELEPQANGRDTKYRIIHAFCQENGCLDGGQVIATGIVIDVNGNIYGMTFDGGKGGQGTVFKLSPNGRGGWAYSVIYNFCSVMNCRDGMSPTGNLTYAGAQQGLPYDGTSPLYGETSVGGAHFSGVAFTLSPRVNGRYQEDVLYAFCAHDVPECPDGASPSAGMTLDSIGNLYGLTMAGGVTNLGAIFKLSSPADRRDGHWTETVVHSFCTLANCADGVLPRGELVIDSSGNLYGATSFGGTGANCSDPISGCGLFYELSPDATFTPLHEFCSDPGCSDGEFSYGLTIDAADNVYGPVETSAGGLIFKYSSGTYATFYNFCPRSKCPGGSYPGAFTFDQVGHILGITFGGGKYGYGTAYKLSP